MVKSPLEQRIHRNDESKREFAREDLILEVTEAIWDALAQRDWTKSDLADALGCKPPHVTQLLNGSRNMTLRTLSDIAFALGKKFTVNLYNGDRNVDWHYGGSVSLCCISSGFTKPIEDIGGNDWNSAQNDQWSTTQNIRIA